MNTGMIDFPSVFTDEQISYITQTVAEKSREVYGDKLRDVILYGSYARGDFEEWSDVDIMIIADADESVCARLKNIVRDDLYDLNYHMNLLLSITVAPYERFEYMKNHYPFYTNILKDGVKLC
jgi:predicted nucleotidyltransferase